MEAKDIVFTTENKGIGKILTDYATFNNSYTGVLIPSQVSKIIECLFINFPLPIMWVDFYGNEIFGNGYIISAVKEFEKGEIKIQNLTGVCEYANGKNYNNLESSLKRRIYEREIQIKIIMNSNKDNCTSIKKLVCDMLLEKYFVVKT